MSDGFLALFRTLAQLKRTRRTGWIDRGVPPEATESVADHTLMTALIAWIVAQDDGTLDAGRVLKLAIIRDMAEALVGDHPPYESHQVPPADDPETRRAFFSIRHIRTPENTSAKRQEEATAAARLLSFTPASVASEIGLLWTEYEGQESAEARFVKEVDRLEAFLQSLSYFSDDPSLPVRGFCDMARKEVSHPLLARIRDAALKEADEP